jgi:hypothetical protein
MPMISVVEALSTLRMDEELKNYLLSKREEWEMFGKMNSHLYRTILMKRMEEANLNGEQRFMVFFLFSVVKNKDRVLKAMEAMAPEDKAKTWFGPVMNFINTTITQYVSDVVRSKKFPAVNIPNCNPGLDILVWCLITHPNKRTVWELSQRTTFSQLNLDANMQAIAREGYAEYWGNVVKISKNPDAVPQALPTPQFMEDYYANSVNDKYLLVNLSLQEVPPADLVNGYSEAEVLDYIRSIDPLQEYVAAQSALQAEINEAAVVVPQA